MAEESKMQVNVTWDGAIGEVDRESFKSNLPEQLKEEHFDMVDTYRDQFAANVSQQLLDRSFDHFKESEDDLSIMETSMGGNTTLAITMNKERHMTTAITTATGDALDAVMCKAQEIIKNTMTE